MCKYIQENENWKESKGVKQKLYLRDVNKFKKL